MWMESVPPALADVAEPGNANETNLSHVEFNDMFVHNNVCST